VVTGSIGELFDLVAGWRHDMDPADAGPRGAGCRNWPVRQDGRWNSRCQAWSGRMQRQAALCDQSV